MPKITFWMICTLGLIILGGSSPTERRRSAVERCNKRLGIHFASDSLIQQYEYEHKMMYRKEDGSSDAGEFIKWHEKLRDKNLTEYCKKYFKTIIPRRHISNIFGDAVAGQIIYLHENDSDGNFNIGVIRCHLAGSAFMKRRKTYFMTDAPEKECVYSLMHSRKGNSPFRIISKVCGFAGTNVPNPIFSHNHPNDRVKVHRRTGIHIAPRNLIKEYEYRHQEMYKKYNGSIDTEKYKSWPLNQNKKYLTEFCAKYLQTVVPHRVRKKYLLGEQVLFELEYTQYNQMSLEIGIIKCHVLPPKGMKTKTYYYYTTESPEPECVYTLLRQTQASICIIVGQICNIKIDDDAKECVNKLDLNTTENVELYNPPKHDAEVWEMEWYLKTINFLPVD